MKISFGKNKPNNAREHKINYDIKSKIVFLVDKDGDKIGNIPFFDALNKANDNGFDLVQISMGPDNVPVCKIMDYGKFCFDKKKSKKLQKPSKINEKKIIQLTPSIDTQDLNTKLKKVTELLENGYKVNIIMTLRGRQLDHPEIAIDMLNKIVNDTKNIAKPEDDPKREGRKAILILAPLAR